jgi:tryptophan synthase alpha chain
MSRIDELFQKLQSNEQKAFMPFITAGDPDLEFTAGLLKTLDAAGCHLCELGIPYSDPIADGPVIQASYTRALGGGTKFDAILDMLKSVTADIKMPVVTMISYAIIYRIGLDAFLDKAIEAGVAGAIVPDMPVDESAEFAEKCKNRDFSLIQLVTPTTPRERAIRIAENSSGFIYYVSVAGITGERTSLPAELADNVSWLREQTDLPICIGFGISKPEHAETLKPVADGLIVGSAIVRRIAAIEEGASRDEASNDVAAFCKEMLSAI